MPPPEDDKTLALPSAALLGTVGSEKDAIDDERTQRVAFDPADLGATLDGMAEAALSGPLSAPRPNAGPMSDPRPNAGKPSAPSVASQGLSSSQHGAQQWLPLSSPSPPVVPAPTSTVPPARQSAPSVTTGPGALTRPAQNASKRKARRPPPPWVVGYLVTCVVLTIMGLAVLWLEYRSFGSLLP